MTFLLVWMTNVFKVMLAFIKDSLGWENEPEPDDRDLFHLLNIEDPDEEYKVIDWKTGKVSRVEKDYFLIEEHFYWDKEIQPQYANVFGEKTEVEVGQEVKYLLEEIKEGAENRVQKVIRVRIENNQQTEGKQKNAKFKSSIT